MKEEGKIGFDNESKKVNNPSVISKEECMFKVDSKGEIIPEVYGIEIYDRDLDFELLQESLELSQALKKKNAIHKVLSELKVKQEAEIDKLKKKVDIEKDNKVRNRLMATLLELEKTKHIEEAKERINSEMLETNIKESQMIIRELSAKIDSTKQIKNIELKPCTISEAYLAFEQLKSIDGKEVDDWVDDIIIRKVSKPQFTKDEVKLLKRDYKIAIKEAIMKVSNYKTKSYKDILVDESLRNTLREKKD